MKANELKAIKNAIRELKSNREYTYQLEQNMIANHKAEIAQYDETTYHGASLISTLENRLKANISKLYDDMGSDIMIHIIYVDGSQCIVTGEEIVAGINPALQHIVYACYSDAYTQYDTFTGCLDDMFQHGENAEEMDEYFSMIEVKFNTAWGKLHK